MNIPFNIPYSSGREIEYIKEAITNRYLSGNGYFTRKCQHFFEERWNFKKALMTTSCTDALEMAALLIDIEPGDEIIIPAYTFVSTALAFIRQGARIVFADSRRGHPGLDEDSLEGLISPVTKAIVPVHYAGIASDMDKIMNIAKKHGIYVIEDAAHAINSYYKGKPLGGIGHLGCFSFHETKPVHCGEGGMLVINDDRFLKRAELIWEKGTDRAAFARGEVSRYEWVETGSSFLPSELNAAFLYAQLEEMEQILETRMDLWRSYYNSLKDSVIKNDFILPDIPSSVKHNASIFYLVFADREMRNRYRNNLTREGIQAISHYLDLSNSPYIRNNYPGKLKLMKNATMLENTLLRLPLFNGLNDTGRIIQALLV